MHAISAALASDTRPSSVEPDRGGEGDLGRQPFGRHLQRNAEVVGYGQGDDGHASQVSSKAVGVEVGFEVAASPAMRFWAARRVAALERSGRSRE